ncbi:MAG: methionine synthase [Pseudonocardiaceae bacterium]|nr:methionine synthase [Pseudonocardiaceae bacterium]
MRTSYRADVVGSLLRPKYLMQAREEWEAGRLSTAAFKTVEDRAVDQAIALQEAIGVDVVSDGELRRLVFFDHFIQGLDGLSATPAAAVRFHGGSELGDIDFLAPVCVTDKIRLRRMLTIEEFAYARGSARKPVKVTLPSPLIFFALWSPEHSRDAYADPFELFADAAQLVRTEARELAALGCEYIQVDAPELAQVFGDPAQRAQWESLGISADRAMTEGVDLVNSVADVPGVSFGLHLCRGNYQSRWIAEGDYTDFAAKAFGRATNYDTFLLEYDDSRSGSFEPLAKLPDDKSAVLGLVSTKHDRLEPADELVGRIEEAERYVSRERLALSTQCGFASDASGNLISDEVQEAKLRLVAEVARRVWG